MRIIFHSIGVIHSPYHNVNDMPKLGREAAGVEAEIVLDLQYLEGIADLRSGDKCQIVVYFHKSKGFKLTVAKRGVGPQTGVFSTHSPNRPNAIGISVIRIMSIEGNRIRFTGVDMLDNTPVLDIKSYIEE